MPGTVVSTFYMNYLIYSLNSPMRQVIYPNFTNAEIAQDYVDSH